MITDFSLVETLLREFDARIKRLEAYHPNPIEVPIRKRKKKSETQKYIQQQVKKMWK